MDSHQLSHCQGCNILDEFLISTDLIKQEPLFIYSHYYQSRLSLKPQESIIPEYLRKDKSNKCE